MREKREYLIKYLLDEMNIKNPIPSGGDEQRALLRGLMNIRNPAPISDEFLTVQDEYLRERAREKGIADVSSIPCISGRMALWRGDITRLNAGAIVNACNSGLTGCYRPNHSCIDNAIHTFAGVQLRLKCAELTHGVPEPTGTARITPAYNLPSEYVLHTVGPICSGAVTDRERYELASCYRSCMRTAAENGVKTIAFCCISTGVFGFPQAEASKIAVQTVEAELSHLTEIEKVIFDVFSETDEELYLGNLKRRQ